MRNVWCERGNCRYTSQRLRNPVQPYLQPMQCSHGTVMSPLWLLRGSARYKSAIWYSADHFEQFMEHYGTCLVETLWKGVLSLSCATGRLLPEEENLDWRFKDSRLLLCEERKSSRACKDCLSRSCDQKASFVQLISVWLGNFKDQTAAPLVHLPVEDDLALLYHITIAIQTENIILMLFLNLE